MTDSIDRILGRLEEKVDQVIETQKRDIEQLTTRLGKVEEITNEYRSIKSMGRGYLIGAAIGGGSVGLWLHDNMMAFLKALKG